MDLGLRGKVALVAAASRGLGRAIALELAPRARSSSCARGERTTSKRRATKFIATCTGAEVHARRRRRRSTREHIDARRRPKRWRSSAGSTFSSRTPAVRPPACSRMHDVGRVGAAVNLTLRSVVELTRAVLPGMRARKWGRIINITSIAAKQPVDNLILSNSIRSAVTGFARTLANEVATDGITVNNILPGYTRTERVEELADATAAKEGISARDVLARFEKRDSDATARRAEGVRGARRVSRVGAGELHHRPVDRRRWRMDQRTALIVAVCRDLGARA